MSIANIAGVVIRLQKGRRCCAGKVLACDEAEELIGGDNDFAGLGVQKESAKGWKESWGCVFLIFWLYGKLDTLIWMRYRV